MKQSSKKPLRDVDDAVAFAVSSEQGPADGAIDSRRAEARGHRIDDLLDVRTHESVLREFPGPTLSAARIRAKREARS